MVNRTMRDSKSAKQRRDQHAMVLRTKRRGKTTPFDTKQRAFAIARVLDDDVPVAQAAEEIGATPSSVYGWIMKTIRSDGEYTGIRMGRRHSKYYRIKDS